MPALPNLASPAQLAALTGRSAGDTTLLAELAAASRAFRGAVHHPVTLTTDDELQLDGNGSRLLQLPRPLPVVVDEEHPFVISIEGVELEAGVDYRLNRRTGAITRTRGRVWPIPPCEILVTYSHGYEAELVASGDDAGLLTGVPDDIQGVVLERAQIGLNTTPGIQARTVLGDSVTYGSSAIGATQQWSDVVAQYAQRTGQRS